MEKSRDDSARILSLGEKVERENELLCVIGDEGLLLDVSEVDAVCIKVEFGDYRFWGQEKIILLFRVFEPRQYEGAVLPMYIHMKPHWKTNPPRRSKLWKSANVACNGCLRKGQKITKSMFVNKAFRCGVRKTEGDAPYSIVDCLIEKLAG
jgi:hypothetical protein